MLRTTTLFIVLILLFGGCSFAVPLGPVDVKTTTIDGDVLFVRIREQGFDSAVYYDRAEVREHDGVVSVRF